MGQTISGAGACPPPQLTDRFPVSRGGLKGFLTLGEAKTLIDDEIQRVRLLTNSSGQVSWTYPVAYSENPIISADVLHTTNQPYSIRVLTLTSTGLSLQVFRSNVVSVLGVDVLAALAAVGADIPVYILAHKA